MKVSAKTREISLLGLIVCFFLLFNNKGFELRTMEMVVYLDYATDVLGEDGSTTDIYANTSRQELINLILSMMMIPVFYYRVLKKLDRKRIWWFSFPIAIAASLVYALLLSQIDRWLNPYFFLSIRAAIPDLTVGEAFVQLQADNFIKVLNACLIAGLAFQIQELLVTKFEKTKKKLRPVGSLYWLSLFILAFVAGTVISHTGLSLSFDQFLVRVPQLLLYAFISLGTGAIFLDHFFRQGKIRIKGEFNLGFKFLFCSMGFFAAAVQRFLWKNLITYNLDITYAWVLTLFLIIIVVICLICYLLYLGNFGDIRTNAGLQAQLEQKVSELNLLKAQISPHFLFNSLNTVYGIALTEDSPKTASGVQKLSEMMRFMLKENTEEYIPVAREIDYINNYIELQKLRLMGSELNLYVDIAEGCEGKMAPMMLVPFIENAFKHGVSMRDYSLIDIKLECRADEVELYVKNTKHQRALPKNEESGIGLGNVKERLEILYKNKYRLEIGEEEGTFEVRLNLDLI